jgi:hypothetical protein
MSGYFFQHVVGRLDPVVVRRVSLEPIDLDRVALLERGCDELDVLRHPGVVVQGNVEYIRGGYRRIVGHNKDAFFLGLLDHAVERIGRVGVDHDDVYALGNEVPQDIRLLGRVAVGDVVHDLVIGDLAGGLVLFPDLLQRIDHDVTPGRTRRPSGDADGRQPLFPCFFRTSEKEEGRQCHEHHGDTD